ncbi:MAG: radical SAM protein, partial [Planctomycetes bacterium]|nr:radical SAM protein [Planctomycetota bacterium]
LSLGVDIVPLKTCTQNCIYCQLGIACKQIMQRQSFVSVEEVLHQLKAKLTDELRADFITFSGSGEPTLNKDIGKIIDGMRKLTDMRIAIITNGTLLSDPQVRADCCKADVVLPSLDAGDAETFEKINHPHTDIRFEKFVEGLCRFRDEYDGQIWLEVFLVASVNTGADQIEKMSRIIERIRPDKVQLNTAVRPTVESAARQVGEEELCEIAGRLAPDAEVIADFARNREEPGALPNVDGVLEMLKRRPCSLEDICNGLGISRRQAGGHIAVLESQNKIASQIRDDKIFYLPK